VAGSEEIKKAIGERTLIGSFGVPEDISSAVLFAAENRFVTGADIFVDGGIALMR
jgi:NAD(P)-dependent dehydrogenase (short-subunit alcohol dehydrogenase family)